MGTLMLRRRAAMRREAVAWPLTLTVEMIYGIIINISDGTAGGNPSWSGTDYIEVPEGSVRAEIETGAYGYGTYLRGAFYDSAHNTISTWGPIYQQTIPVFPAGTVYVRFSAQKVQGSGSAKITFFNEFSIKN